MAKGGSIAFDTAQIDAFNTLKKRLTESPVLLSFCDWEKPFEVHCDASDVGLGAVLYQVVNGERKVLAYGSKMLTEGEKKYLSYEKEALALVWSLDMWEHYLKWKPFKVVTDCRSLVYMMNNKSSARISKWIWRVQQLDFVVQHQAGKLAEVPDALSRQPLPDTNPYNQGDIEELYSGSECKPFAPIKKEPALTVLPVSTRSGAVTQTPVSVPVGPTTKKKIAEAKVEETVEEKFEKKAVSILPFTV